MISRRKFLGAVAGGVAIGAGVAVPLARQAARQEREARWGREGVRRPARSRVAALKAASYDESLLEDVVRRGVALCGVEVRNRRVVLKPNLVEFDPRGVINTHPALVAAAARAFRSLGAREVVVGEGPGHRRDNDYLLDASGLGAAPASRFR
jgi:hypothetical protein